MEPINAALTTMGVIFFISFMLEGAIEYFFGILFEKVAKLEPYSWALMYVSAIVGIIAAFGYQFDLVFLFAKFLGQSVGEPSIMGILLTGLAIGRGSNYLHDFVGKFFIKVE